jgi:hypothetical protein
MALAMKQDEMADPMPVTLFCPGAEVAAAANDRNLFKQARRLVTP